MNEKVKRFLIGFGIGAVLCGFLAAVWVVPGAVKNHFDQKGREADRVVKDVMLPRMSPSPMSVTANPDKPVPSARIQKIIDDINLRFALEYLNGYWCARNGKIDPDVARLRWLDIDRYLRGMTWVDKDQPDGRSSRADIERGIREYKEAHDAMRKVYMEKVRAGIIKEPLGE